MKRLLARILIFGILGAIITTVVAWGCAFWIPQMSPRSFGEPEDFMNARWQQELSFRGMGVGYGYGFDIRYAQSELTGRSWQDVRDSTPRVGDLEPYAWPQVHEQRLYFYGRGWPFVSHALVKSERISWKFIDRSHQLLAPRYSVETGWDGWEVPAWSSSIRLQDPFVTMLDEVPLRPIWPGFLLNTLVWGTYLWFLTVCRCGIRRWWRRRRGQCIHCGYDLRGLTAATDRCCPECGRGQSTRCVPAPSIPA